MIDKFQHLVSELYSTVNALESMFPGRHFTPDGHMLGSIGECLVADAIATGKLSNFANTVTACQPNNGTCIVT